MKLKTWQIDIALALAVGTTFQVEAAQASVRKRRVSQFYEAHSTKRFVDNQN
jgi:hypothetical protein